MLLLPPRCKRARQPSAPLGLRIVPMAAAALSLVGGGNLPPPLVRSVGWRWREPFQLHYMESGDVLACVFLTGWETAVRAYLITASERGV